MLVYNHHGLDDIQRPLRSEIYTAQAVTDKSIYYFHVAADRPEEVLQRLSERKEYQEIGNIRRIEVFEGELFARYEGQLPVKLFTLP
jgi:hypothetical protein